MMETSYKLRVARSREGTSLEKATIVEFVGPPGAGKTTSCECFSELLKERNLTVYDTQDIKKYLHGMNRYQKLGLYLKTVLSKGHTFLFFTGVLVFNRIYSINSVYRYVRLSVFNLALKQLVKKREIDVVLLDQWSIQELWSATIFKLRSYHAIKNHLKRFYFKTNFVLYFDIDIATASERISKRNTNRSRFDRMDADMRLAELEKYNTYLFQLFENSDCKNKHTFSTRQSPDENARYFMALLDLSCNHS